MPNNKIECASGSVCVTPPLGTAISGYFTERRAKGVYDDLYANICIIKKNDTKVVLISADFCVASPWSAYVREEIGKRLGISSDAVLSSATHTHTGPVLAGNLVNQAYVDDMKAKIVQKAVDLDKELEPCTIEFGSGQDKRFSFNRRYIMKDGRVITNPGANNPDIVKPAGPVDYSVNVIKILTAKRKVKSIIFNHGNHADTIYGEWLSADWPGYLSKKLKDQFGDITVLTLNGTEGDVNHLDPMNNRVVQNLDEAKMIGFGYAETAIKAAKKSKPLNVEAVAFAFESIQIPKRVITEAEYADAKRTVDELKDNPEASMEGKTLESQHIVKRHPAVMLMFARGIVSAYEKRLENPNKTLLMDAIRIGDLVLLGVSGELFTGVGLDIKKKSKFKHTLIVVCAMDSTGYLGTKKAYQLGGYETLSGERVCDDAEDYIKKAADRLLKKVKAANS